MKQRLSKIICTAFIAAAIFVLTACGSSITGTWYSVNTKTGEESSLTFEKNGTWYTKDGYTGEWEESESAVTMLGFAGSTLQKNNDGTLVALGSDEIYYREQSAAQKAYEEAKQARINECNEQKEAAFKDIKSQIVGTWKFEGESSAATVVINENGSWSQDTETYYKRMGKVVSTESMHEEGIWEVTYSGNQEEYQDTGIQIRFFYPDGAEHENEQLWNSWKSRSITDGWPWATYYDGKVQVLNSNCSKI